MLCMRRKQEFRRFNCGVDYQRKNIMQLLVAMSCGGDKEFRINRLYHWLKTVVRRIIESGSVHQLQCHLLQPAVL